MTFRSKHNLASFLNNPRVVQLNLEISPDHSFIPNTYSHMRPDREHHCLSPRAYVSFSAVIDLLPDDP
jgi:hypothetical protein